MVFFNGQQIIEAIDKIKIMLHPCIRQFINFNPHIDPKNHLTLHYTKNAFRHYYYLSIHAEYINPSINMLENIANAIYELVQKQVITIWDDIFEPIDYENRYLPANGEPDKYYYKITRDFILNHLEYFVGRITELEFFFDFPCECIEIYKETSQKMLNINNEEDLKKIDKEISKLKVHGDIFSMYNNNHVIIYKGTTLYSKDYDPSKKESTLIYYDRAEKLIKYNNVMSKDEIKKNIFKKRIEFRIKNYHALYLTINNLQGPYETIIERYIPLLAIYYHKLFKGTVFVNSILHKHINRIYELADKSNERYRGNELETVNMIYVVREHRYIHFGHTRITKLFELKELLNKNENNHDDISKK